MSEATYKVVCRGVAEGNTLEQVKAGVAALFKKTPDQIAGLLSGKPTVIKKDLSRSVADKYLKAMSRAGARCEVVAHGAAQPGSGAARPHASAKPVSQTVKPRPAAKSAPAEVKLEMEAKPEPDVRPTLTAKKAPAPSAKAAVSKVPAAGQMTCPKCGAVQPEKADCTKCGIVIAKFLKQAGQTDATPGGPPPLPGRTTDFQDGPPPFRDEDQPSDIDLGNISRVGVHYDVEVKEPIKFGETLPTVFSYPFQGNGLFIMIGGVIFLTIAQYLSFIPLGGGILRLFVSGYLVAYMMKIVNHSADGELSPPDWPDFSHMGSDIIGPFLRFVFIGIFSYLPAILFGMLAGYLGFGTGLILFGVVILVLLGSAYYPMALLAVSMSGRMAGMMPNVVIPSIFKVLGDYMICLGAFLAVIIINVVMKKFLIIPVPVVGNLIANALSIYFLMVQMHILGLLYNANAEKLDWYV